MKPPEPWENEEAMEADLRLWLLPQLVEYPEECQECQNEALKAFRIGWRAGAYYSAFQMLHWTRAIILGIEEPERNEQNDGNE